MPDPITRTPIQIEKLAAVFGRSRSRWLRWRERRGDRSLVTLRYSGHRHWLRLGSTDPLVWYSVFHQQDYGAALPFEPATIIDAGAYTGLSAIYLANRYPGARILAIEPDPSNYRLLLRNIRPYPAITPVNAALWHEDTRLQFHFRPEGHWASSVLPGDSGETVEVEGIGMRTALGMLGTDTVDLLKIDVEGAEKEIMAHAAPWIGRVGAIFIELHDRLQPGCTDALEAVTAGFERNAAAPMTELLINRRRLAPAEPTA